MGCGSAADLGRDIQNKTTMKTTTTKMNYYQGTTSIRPRVYCADGVSLSIQASEYAYCHPRQRYNRHWTTYVSVEVGYIYDENTQPFSPPDIWREYQSGNDEIWAYVPVSVVEEFIEAHGGEVEAPLDPFEEKIIE